MRHAAINAKKVILGKLESIIAYQLGFVVKLL